MSDLAKRLRALQCGSPVPPTESVGGEHCDHEYILCRKWFRSGWICLRCGKWSRSFVHGGWPYA